MKNPRSPRVSEAEWEILNVLWKKAPLSASEVFEALEEKSWKLNTVRTFLTRLEKKGAVSAQLSTDSAKVFRPAVSREVCVKAESDSFLERVFEGGAADLLLHFAQRKSLSEAELSELAAILEQKRKKEK
jgi:BlaI family penicillinase repressor